ncbi:sulfate/molybdate ABC transporter ATP-binding protein [Dactylosporangium sp. NPDC048998]|uniref:sulfate/molybdate ABC transporter ATP-binding protein n=1 Tax=Dactylosporangium sp. NPDC048998 TaxID=3363976 RepID=UPI00371DDF73
MAIEVRDVNKSFGKTPVLRDISIDIASGSLTALLGPSGGGKSTLLRVIAGLEQPDTGSVRINEVDATRLTPQRRNVGFVFQHYAAFKHMTVYRNVAFGLEVRHRPKADIRKRVMELLELVHLDQFADRYPAQLSGGQRQRMALARALAPEPQVLLLDEPFGALDAQVRKELRTWLRRLHDEVHVTTVFVTHDQEEAMDVSDEIVVLADGVVQQVGSPHDIYENPANPFVMSFLGPVTRLDGRLVRPHDVSLSREPAEGGTAAVVTRVVPLGFEVRIEAKAGDVEVWAQLTRAGAKAIDVKPGDTLYFSPETGARTLAAV